MGGVRIVGARWHAYAHAFKRNLTAGGFATKEEAEAAYRILAVEAERIKQVRKDNKTTKSFVPNVIPYGEFGWMAWVKVNGRDEPGEPRDSIEDALADRDALREAAGLPPAGRGGVGETRFQARLDELKRKRDAQTQARLELGAPPGPKRLALPAPKNLERKLTIAAADTQEGAQECDDEELSAIDDAATVVMPLAHLATLAEPSSRSGSPSLRNTWQDRIVSPSLLIGYREEAAQLFEPLTRGEQLDAYCGMNTELVKHARDVYGSKPGGMSRNAIKNWYKKDLSERLPGHLRGRQFGTESGDLQVCHIVSTAKGGHDWVFNYFIALVEVNQYFNKWLPKEWDVYIGPDATKQAETFARWVACRAKAALTFGQFDPIADHFLAR